MPSVRRATDWMDTVVDSTLAINTEERIDLMGTIDQDEARGLTITRILMCVSLTPNPIGAVTGLMQVHIGIGVASREAFAAGVVPDPETSPEEPQRGWLYRCNYAVIDDPTPGYPWPLVKEDLHAQRKLDSGNAYMVLMNRVGYGANTFSVQAMGIIRMLVKLP